MPGGWAGERKSPRARADTSFVPTGDHRPERASARDLLVLASEELRGPLTSVVGYLQVLIDGEAGELTDGQQRVAEIAARSTERLERLVDDLIVVAQVHADGLAPARGPVDMVALVRERVAFASPALRARGVTVSISCVQCPDVMGDLPALAQMVDHMLEGALGFVEFGGRIDLDVGAEPEAGVVVEIRDDGLPVAAEDLAGLMDGRSGALPSSPRALLGSRLGMYLVRAVAEAHGGSAAARLDDGRTTVRVVIPHLVATP